jgi:TRAP-type mannitol/chloroaromatic compound transport system permease large subunit
VIALVMLVALFVLVLINVPIAVALGVIAAVAMVAKSGMDSLLGAAVVLFEGATKFPLIAIPLFVLAGAIMNTSGISRRLIAFASALLGFVRGGLSMVNIGTSMFFAEISGSAVADVAAITPSATAIGTLISTSTNSATSITRAITAPTPHAGRHARRRGSHASVPGSWSARRARSARSRSGSRTG